MNGFLERGCMQLIFVQAVLLLGDIYIFRKQFDRRLDEIEALLTTNRI
jgi:hypothetical protein